MPKNTNHGGASYASHTDVSPDGVSEPEWQPDWQPNAFPVDAKLEASPADEGDLGSDSIERPKPKRKDAKANAGVAKGKGEAKNA